jgi:hypothetical protein
MDNLTEEFFSQIGFNPQIEYDEIEYRSDYSDFTVVDGEEGDYGIIKHYSLNSSLLVAITTIKGGDDEDTEFTKYGKELLGARAIEILRKSIENIEGITETSHFGGK